MNSPGYRLFNSIQSIHVASRCRRAAHFVTDPAAPNSPDALNASIDEGVQNRVVADCTLVHSRLLRGSHITFPEFAKDTDLLANLSAPSVA